MQKFYFLILLMQIGLFSFAQKKEKPKLIIYGQGEAALASAIQASNSNVPVIWINSDHTFKSILTEGQDIKRVNSYQNLDAGLWAEFLKLSLNSSIYSDSVFNASKKHLNPRISINTFQRMIDSAKNLRVINNVRITKITKSGKKWRIDLSNKESYKVFAVLDASLESELLSLINKKEKLPNSAAITNPSIPSDQLYKSTLYRTSLLVVDQQVESIAPAPSLIKPYADKFFVLYGVDGLLKHLSNSVDEVPTRMIYGQTLGAIASYCAFFEVSVDKINTRTLQGELFDFKAKFIPFHDVSFEDIHYQSIQKVGLTGIFKGKVDSVNQNAAALLFDPESHVSSMELEPILHHLYTRSQIWFADKKIEELKLKDLLSLIKFVALKGNELDDLVRNGWVKRFRFSGEFDPECFVTRKQAAVLIDTYLQPFNVKINSTGAFSY